MSLGRALHNEVLKVNGKIFAFLRHDRLVVKLPAPQARALVAANEAVPFESGGRRMKEWVAVELPAAPADHGLWRQLMADAMGYVGTVAITTFVA